METRPTSLGILLHPTRTEARETASQFVAGVSERGLRCHLVPAQQELLPVASEPLDLDNPPDLDLLVVFGGDGTILKAAELAQRLDIPLLGVNLGHVGFLAELEAHEVESLVEAISTGDYSVEPRLTLRVDVHDPDGTKVWSSFAMNEVSLEKAARERMVEVLVSIDGRPLSQWGCDGVLVSTPTGSTAYAFSAGGPVMWPDVQAIIVVPLSAHALFARPLVLSPLAAVDLDVQPAPFGAAVVWCDGRRSVDIEPGSRITVNRGDTDIRLVRLQPQPFADRLVKKFGLPVQGWRAR
ncbi:NAD kinase [Aestuariimicrobium ganziense]|uniref:NAD kinase n=1 Tax=Aestuariimicrobium ganziense TaxID=2773677 RepID=UPI00194539D6|nr:NAD kinase [Aestuariimicrobium ganziense]